jgi:hypothetical protein
MGKLENAYQRRSVSKRTAIPDPRVMELYKLAVEMADRVSSRRAAANAFFVTLNTAFISVAGLFQTATNSHLIVFSAFLVGVVANLCWWVLLRTYRKLNTAKFVIINKIESDYLPVKIFSDEWQLIKNDDAAGGRWSKVKMSFSELGDIERKIPLVFGLLYFILFLGSICR